MCGCSIGVVGKISDIFAGQGITESFPTDGNAEGMLCIAEKWEQLEAGLHAQQIAREAAQHP